jgi:hypothetical protein
MSLRVYPGGRLLRTQRNASGMNPEARRGKTARKIRADVNGYILILLAILILFLLLLILLLLLPAAGHEQEHEEE